MCTRGANMFIICTQHKVHCYAVLRVLLLIMLACYRIIASDHDRANSCEGIDHLENLSLQVFIDSYKGKRPVLFRSGANNTLFRSRVDIAFLSEHFARTKIQMGKPKELTYGISSSSTRLGNYLHNMRNNRTRKYMFMNLMQHPPLFVDSKGVSLMAEYRYPPALQQNFVARMAAYLAIGNTGSGIPFHFHSEAMNEVFLGQKKWYMYDIDRVRVGPCTQSVGEVMYVPEGMYHRVTNIGDTVAISIQNPYLGGTPLQQERNPYILPSRTEL